MTRIIIALISLPLLAWIMSPFTSYLLEARGTFAYYLAETHLVNWLGISAIFASIALILIITIYSFMK